MSLRITKNIEPIQVSRIVLCLYGVPGLGKTSTAFTAEKPILLDFDRGAHRSRNRGDSVQVEKWEDILAITAEDMKPYKTVVIDTAGRALDCLTPKLIDADPKMGRGGVLTLQGYGRLKSEFTAWLKMLQGFGLDVVLLCHSDEKHQGDDLIERLDMQGGSKNEIYKSADVMGRLYLKGGKRMLNFSPTDTSFGKTPAQMQPIEVPDFEKDPYFLGNVISATKGKLNELSELQTQAAAAQTAWKARTDAAKTADDFTALVAPANDTFEPVRGACKRMLVAAAKVAGFALDKDHAKFVKEDAAPKAQSDDKQTSAQSSPSSMPSQGSPTTTVTTATPTSKKAK